MSDPPLHLFRVAAKNSADAELAKLVQEFLNSIEGEIIDDVAEAMVSGRLGFSRDFQQDCLRWEDDGGLS